MSGKLTLHELLDGLSQVSAVLGDRELAGLTLDSREVVRDGGFVALPGARSHGLDYRDQVREKGAACILYQPPLPGHIAPADDLVGVDALKAKLGEIADRFHSRPSVELQVVGVTGTNGKTSTVQLLAQALADSPLGPCGHIGTLGIGLGDWIEAGERTTPDVLRVHAALDQLRQRGARAAAMEVSSHALDQGRVDGVRFAVAVFTNLTRDHLDYHHTMDAYGAAKAQLFEACAPGAAVINIDDAFGAALALRVASDCPLWTTSAAGNPTARLRAEQIELDAQGLRFELIEDGVAWPLRSALVGRFNVDNLLAVAAALRALGLPLSQVMARLARLQPVRGRMNRIDAGPAAPLVVVDYAHTPDALEQALRSLRAHTRGRLICVFGCGGERDRGKRPQMAVVAESLADQLIVTDDNPRGEEGDVIVAEIIAGLREPARTQVQRDRAQAIQAAIAAATLGDTVLIAGKGHETYQEVGGQRRPFDDAAIAAACLRESAA